MFHISELIKRDLDRQGKLPIKWYDIPDKPITDKCFIYVDAINNTGNGHSNSVTSWKNLCDSSNNGIKVGSPKWQDDALVLSSQGSGYRFAVNKATNITIEVVFDAQKYAGGPEDNNRSDVSVLVGNDNSGGSRLSIFGDTHKVGAISKAANVSDYVDINHPSDIQLNTKLYAAYTCGSNRTSITLSSNSYIASQSFGTLVHTQSCPWAVGFEPTIKSPWYTDEIIYQFYGKIHSVRVHSRVLTPEEIRKNMLYERNRYNF